MSLAAHGLLARIAEHKRDAEAEVLVKLTDYKQKLLNTIQLSEHAALMLQSQHDMKLKQGTQAMELMMLDQSIAEQQQRILEVRFEVVELDKAIAQQRQKWSKHHKKHVAHEKMHDIARVKQKRMVENKLQIGMDNQFSATAVARKRSGEA